MDREALSMRKIQPTDNPQVAAIIRQVLPEFGAPCEGTAFADPELDRMFETYQSPGSAYWVIEAMGRILGGGGIAPLKGGGRRTCELQKMYFMPELRGKGMGDALIRLALDTARSMGYNRCYLETMPYMENAVRLYRRHGFQNLEAPLGATGHNACQVWMEKAL